VAAERQELRLYKEMQLHRMGIISNFFAQKVVNFEQIPFAMGRMLHLIEAMCSSKSGGNLIYYWESESGDEVCGYIRVPLGDPLLTRLNEMHPDRRYEDDPRAGRRMRR
jgi:hypothetical protein